MEKEKEEKILRAFENCSWEPSKEKIAIELDSRVDRFSTLLFSTDNWKQLYNLLMKSINEGKAILISNYFRSLGDIKRMVTRLMQDGYEYILAFVAEYFAQFKGYSESDAKRLNDVLMSFLQENILERRPEALEFCESCKKVQIIGMSGEREEICKCGSRLFKIFKCKLNENVRKSLLNNQFLEIFVKNCFHDIGLKLVSKEINGKKISTSIQYRVPSPVEIDVAAIYGSRVFVCECKTAKVKPNQIEAKLSQLHRLVNSMKEEGIKFKVIYWLITTEEIDKNVQPSVYVSSYEWLEDFIRIQGEDIPKLKEKFREHISTLP